MPAEDMNNTTECSGLTLKTDLRRIVSTFCPRGGISCANYGKKKRCINMDASGRLASCRTRIQLYTDNAWVGRAVSRCKSRFHVRRVQVIGMEMIRGGVLSVSALSGGDGHALTDA